MSVVRNILVSYRMPGRVMAGILASGEREDRALAYLMVGCFLMFVARLPVLSRQAYLSGEEFSSLAGGAFVGGVFMAPLLFYGIAALSHVISNVVGGKGTWLRARLALFWSVLVISPMMLFQGIVAGFIGTGGTLTMVGVLIGILFLMIWVGSLRVAEGFSASDAV